ncbi:unnamed protein product [Amoebophrya sp. A25]|nr:unnamed protein product [Amoebophrya sp. A25]|eukprot:GSA25T00007695001.1
MMQRNKFVVIAATLLASVDGLKSNIPLSSPEPHGEAESLSFINNAARAEPSSSTELNRPHVAEVTPPLTLSCSREQEDATKATIAAEDRYQPAVFTPKRGVQRSDVETDPFSNPLSYESSEKLRTEWWNKHIKRVIPCREDLGMVLELKEPRKMYFHHGTSQPDDPISFYGRGGCANGPGVYVTPKVEVAQHYGKVIEVGVAVQRILFLDHEMTDIGIKPGDFMHLEGKGVADDRCAALLVANGNSEQTVRDWGNIDLVVHSSRRGRLALLNRFYADPDPTVSPSQQLANHVVSLNQPPDNGGGKIPRENVRKQGEHPIATAEDFKRARMTHVQGTGLSRRVLATQMALDAFDWLNTYPEATW